jgi:hypothetical protein
MMNFKNIYILLTNNKNDSIYCNLVESVRK